MARWQIDLSLAYSVLANQQVSVHTYILESGTELRADLQMLRDKCSSGGIESRLEFGRAGSLFEGNLAIRLRKHLRRTTLTAWMPASPTTPTNLPFDQAYHGAQLYSAELTVRHSHPADFGLNASAIQNLSKE